MPAPANQGDVIQKTNNQCACITRTNVLGLTKGYVICCYDGPDASFPNEVGLFGDDYDNYWNIVTSNITGTIDITSGTTQINGTNTVFTSQLSPGDKVIIGQGGPQSCIDTVVDNTTVTLSEAYTGATLSGSNMWKL